MRLATVQPLRLGIGISLQGLLDVRSLEIRDLRRDYDRAHALLCWAWVFGLSAEDFTRLAIGSAHIRGMP